MLIVTKTQMAVFEGAARVRFIDGLASRLRKRFDAETRRLSEEDLRVLIALGIERSQLYNILVPEDVSSYIEFMLSYGDGFDTDPEFNWAGQVLRTSSISGADKIRYIRQLKKSIPESKVQNG